MNTFFDLQKQLHIKVGRRLVLLHLSNLIEEEFLSPSPEIKPKRFLLNDERVPVSQEVLNGVVETMLDEVSELDDDIKIIMESTLKSSKGENSKSPEEA